MNKKKLGTALLGTSSILLSIAMIAAVGYSIADTWRSSIDNALGTQSYVTNTEDPKYVSEYKTGEEMMNAAKELSVREGAEGTVIMKNENSVLPLAKTSKIALFGGASYDVYHCDNTANNTDQVNIVDAFEDAGMTVDPTLKDFYINKVLGDKYTETTNPWAGTKRTYTWGPNKTAGDYTGFKITELNPSKFTEAEFGLESGWESKVNADVGIVTFARPGGEGTTYKPGSALDTNGEATGKNPLALSDDELAVVDKAKSICSKVIVLLDTSCTIEVGPLVKGEHAVDGIAYIGIPNDYQLTGVVKALTGDVNPTGALADTYAVDSTSSPAMMNFGGDYYSDYTTVSDFTDSRWPGVEIGNEMAGSFGGAATYNGGSYLVEAEGIYTGYNYYETRYYDSIANPSYKATAAKGASNGATSWDYANEVSYPFGFGLSYLDYEEKLLNVEVEDKAGGNITATIAITNKSEKDGDFLAQLYVQTPYTDYDKTNKVEKSAIQFLKSGKTNVKAGATANVKITVPTKYMASYDYTKAKTYIMDSGTYYFATGNGSHAAVNNVLTAQGKTSSVGGDTAAVKTWENTGETDITTYSISDSGAKITNSSENIDMNYYLPGTVTYLSRSDWDTTYPKNYNTSNDGKGLTIADSSKKEEWLKELRNQQYTINTTGTVENSAGTKGTTFDAASIGYEQQTDINNDYWDKLVDAIPAEDAIGAVAHGGNQSDTLTNIENPIVKQYDGPCGFNNQTLSANNGASAAEDPYFVDPTSEAGKFKVNINAPSLVGSAFNPDLAYDWGKILGNTGLWTGCYQIWGAALNYHRSPYNGRNTEYPSEDPMLCNFVGTEITKGTRELGILSGPKHIGFNDQEHNRAGISVYMNEQKMRETDLRGFQGSVEEAGALGLMIAFNRLGAVNASHHTGMINTIIRSEWNFKGLISTDMMSNKYYFNPEASIMATITQMADFAGNDSNLHGSKDGTTDKTWTYITPAVASTDQTLVDAARLCMKYQLYAFANSAILNISTVAVTPWWDTAIRVVEYGSIALGVGALVGYGAVYFTGKKKKPETTGEGK
ncbi:MAG: glycoside hydrolase family 3 N-terminal domain-containing protein [Bacilli bacterium]